MAAVKGILLYATPSDAAAEYAAGDPAAYGSPDPAGWSIYAVGMNPGAPV